MVESPVADDVDNNWGHVVSRITVRDDLAAGLAGLEEFSHVIIVFLMHKATFAPGEDLVRRPRGRADMPMLGIFAQRAKFRPNPIAITPVKLISIEGSTLTVLGLDAINGTPVLDIKPYFPQFDHVEDPVTPEWVARLMQGYF